MTPEEKKQRDSEAIEMFNKEIDALDKKDVKKVTHDDIHFLADRIWGHQFKEDYKKELLKKLDKVRLKVYRYYHPGINTPAPLLRKYAFHGFWRDDVFQN